MANENGWGDGSVNNSIGWGKGAINNSIGWGSVYSVSSAGLTDIIGTLAVDPDAQAFITAASITDPTQQSAINQLVVDLKGYNIWTKMKAIYPIVGGVASSHAVNLKTPGTYNLTFSSGWTHSSTGMTPLNAYADTFFKPSNSTYTNFNFGFYLRTNSTGVYAEFGFADVAGYSVYDYPNLDGNGYVKYGGADNSYTGGDTRGMYSYNQNSNQLKRFKNGSLTNTFSNTPTNISGTTLNYFVAARNVFGTAGQFSNRQRAFQYIADGLTDAENTNLYTAIQAFQTTLGRSIGTQTVSDADAQAFVTAANIDDQVQANAINNLVIGLKADGLWTKSYVLYPIVGGVSTAHAVNLKSPGTYNMSLSSGWSHSANGMIGTNAYVNTQFNPTTAAITKSNFGVSVYSRSNTSGYKVDIGAVDTPASYVWLVPRYDSVTDFAGSFDDSNFNGNYLTNTLGLISVVRDSATTQKLYQAGVQKGTRTGFNATGNINQNIYFGARNNLGIPANYSDRQYAFVAIHEGFNTTEIANFNTRIQTYQTTLNRQV